MNLRKEIENLTISTVPMTQHEVDKFAEIANKHAEDFCSFMIKNGAKVDESNKKSVFYYNEKGLFEGTIKKHLKRYNNA